MLWLLFGARLAAPIECHGLCLWFLWGRAVVNNSGLLSKTDTYFGRAWDVLDVLLRAGPHPRSQISGRPAQLCAAISLQPVYVVIASGAKASEGLPVLAH